MKLNPPLPRKLLLALFSAFVLSSCGGGGGGSNSVVIIPPSGGGSAEPVWTPGVFAASSQFSSRCAIPRTGINPATNSPYPDISGSTTFENFFLRSWSDETYLWYNEITDQNPANFSNRLDYFDELRTTAVTASGTNKDNFHFTIPTDEYQQRVSSGSSAGYGAEFAIIESSVPREIRIAFTEPNSPAENQFFRGTEILTIDGEDAINGTNVDVLNAGLRPAGPGEIHTFTVRDIGTTATRTVTLTSQDVTTVPVNVNRVITTATGPVGYLHFTTFGTTSAEQGLFDAVTSLSNQGVTDLVLDLRYNGGGFLDISAELGFMIAGSARTNGRTFDKLTFNAKHPTFNPVTGERLAPTPFHSQGQGFSVNSGTQLPTLDLNRVYILSTSGTCSASEAVINALRGIDVEVVLIGTRTCGKPYGFYATDNCGETYFTIQFRGENDKGFGEYSDGFTPMDDPDMVGEAVTGCLVPDDFTTPLGNVEEYLLKTALAYRAEGKCPTATVQEAITETVWRDPATSLYTDKRMRDAEFLDTSRILDAPQQ